MIRISNVFIAVIAMTGLAAAQDAGPPPPPPGGPPPPPGNMGPAAPGVGQNTVGADVAVVLPTGDYADLVDFAIGVFGRFEHKLNPNLSITGRLGYLYNQVSVDDVSLSMILLVGGARYNLSNTSADGIFLTGELGFNYIRASVDTGGGSLSDTETDLTLILGGGYQVGKIQARAGLFYTFNGDNDADTGNALGLMGSVGFDFATL
ncbi:MAG: hypothetical protein ABI867_08475 [Kofleriaceae bacterium]